MQAGNPLARRTDDGKDGGGYPSMGSVAAKFRGPNVPRMPPFVGLADSWKADVYGAGHMGAAYEPVKGNELPGRLALPKGVDVETLHDRAELRGSSTSCSATSISASDGRIGSLQPRWRSTWSSRQRCGRHSTSPAKATKLRDAYGRISVGEKALLARRLVEAGTTFVLVSGAWGYFDHHGDNVPPWGGIQKGLTPILPTIDQTLTTLIEDLDARGLLDSTLVLMLGEFGRSPVMTKDAGRDHWTNGDVDGRRRRLRPAGERGRKHR